MSKQLDALRVVNNEVIFEKANGEKMVMPNLTALLKLYNETSDEAIKERAREIFNHEIGSLLICEIMIDLETGEISKTMRHVSTYNIILESHLEKAKEQFEALRAQGEVEGTFEEAVFATFPYGIVIERVKFPQFTNTEYVKEII